MGCLDTQIVDLTVSKFAANRSIFMILSVYSIKLGMWDIPLLYVFSENAAFANELALPAKAKFSHIINVQYGGGGCGGGQSSGIWILNFLKRIECKVLVTDNNYFEGSGDLRIYDLYPHLIPEEEYDLEKIYTIPSNSWSGSRDVDFKLVS